MLNYFLKLMPLGLNGSRRAASPGLRLKRKWRKSPARIKDSNLLCEFIHILAATGVHLGGDQYVE
jgi:hypothetical protein